MGLLDPWSVDYTLMTIIINLLTFLMMFIIIETFELANNGERPTPNPLRAP